MIKEHKLVTFISPSRPISKIYKGDLTKIKQIKNYENLKLNLIYTQLINFKYI